VEIIPIENSAN